MKIYLRLLSLIYAMGAILHLLDVLDLRLPFSQMDLIWKIWIIYLLIADSFASIGLWKQTVWGQCLFLLIAGSQLIAYLLFSSFFGDQTFLILFHVVCLIVYGSLKLISKKSAQA